MAPGMPGPGSAIVAQGRAAAVRTSRCEWDVHGGDMRQKLHRDAHAPKLRPQWPIRGLFYSSCTTSNAVYCIQVTHWQMRDDHDGQSETATL